MAWTDQLNGDSITWLLEADNPNVRYLALRDLLDRLEGDKDLEEARRVAYQTEPLARVLKYKKEPGYWVKPGAGYSPKYKSTVWSIILLAQLGARICDEPAVVEASQYLLDHALTPDGQFGTNGKPSNTIDCLQGNLCWALSAMGCDDPRLEKAYDWMARSVTGDGVAPQKDTQTTVRYYAYKCGPTFACGANNKQPCAWGGVKVMLAFASLAENKKTPLIKKAIQQGAEFLLGIDPVDAAYPIRVGDKPNRAWWKFGFPVYYVTDLLQNVEALVRLGYQNDPRLAHALQYIRDKQDQQGRWLMEYDYAEKTWGKYGEKKQPNKWVTLRALRVLKMAGSQN